MNLREIAEFDLSITLEDDEKGFGVPVKVTDSSGNTADLIAQTGDVHLLYETGNDQNVTNRTPHISLRISSIVAAGLELPSVAVDSTTNPYTFEFTDQNGNIRKYTVTEPRFDLTLGIVTVILDLLKS